MCNYCGCENLAVIGRYMAEHVEIINRAGDLRRAVESGDRAVIDQQCRHLAEALHPHTKSEEVGLFAVMKRDDDFRPTVESLCREHLTLDEQLDAIAAGRLDFMEGFMDQLREHIDREENGLFPAAAVSLSGDDWDEVMAHGPEADGGNSHTDNHVHDEDHGAVHAH